MILLRAICLEIKKIVKEQTKRIIFINNSETIVLN